MEQKQVDLRHEINKGSVSGGYSDATIQREGAKSTPAQMEDSADIFTGQSYTEM